MPTLPTSRPCKFPPQPENLAQQLLWRKARDWEPWYFLQDHAWLILSAMWKMCSQGYSYNDHSLHQARQKSATSLHKVLHRCSRKPWGPSLVQERPLCSHALEQFFMVSSHNGSCKVSSLPPGQLQKQLLPGCPTLQQNHFCLASIWWPWSATEWVLASPLHSIWSSSVRK